MEKLPKTAIVSIGHRSTLDQFHTRQIAMNRAPDGLFQPVDSVPQAAE
jgi:putative ATP-binding cassette transporter